MSIWILQPPCPTFHWSFLLSFLRLPNPVPSSQTPCPSTCLDSCKQMTLFLLKFSLTVEKADSQSFLFCLWPTNHPPSHIKCPKYLGFSQASGFSFCSLPLLFWPSLLPANGLNYSMHEFPIPCILLSWAGLHHLLCVSCARALGQAPGNCSVLSQFILQAGEASNGGSWPPFYKRRSRLRGTFHW